MKKKIKPLNLLLLISLPFLLAGLILTIGSYNRYLCVEASAEQLEFIKNLPHSVAPGSTAKMPLYSENLFLSGNSGLFGNISCEYYEGRISVRRIKVHVRSLFFSGSQMEFLLDARSRN